MASIYTYLLSEFVNATEVNQTTFGQQITVAPEITVDYICTTSTDTAISIHMPRALTGPEQAALNALVVAYTDVDNPVDNTAAGSAAFGANVTGSSNTVYGASALAASTNISGVTAIGASTFQANTTGTGGTAVGYAALQSNTTGSRNTAVGSQALMANVTGNDSTALGYDAGATATGSRNTFVGSGADIPGVQSVFGTSITSSSGDQVVLGTPTIGPRSTYLLANRIYQSVTYPTASTLLPLDATVILARCAVPNTNDVIMWSLQIATTATFNFNGIVATNTNIAQVLVQAVKYDTSVAVSSKIGDSNTITILGNFGVAISASATGNTVELGVRLSNSRGATSTSCLLQLTDLTPGVARVPLFAN